MGKWAMILVIGFREVIPTPLTKSCFPAKVVAATTVACTRREALDALGIGFRSSR